MKKEKDKSREKFNSKQMETLEYSARYSMQEQEEDKKELQAFGVSSIPSVFYEY